MNIVEELEMKTNRTLISCAMLTAMSDVKSIDNLKLLESFVKVCISDTNDIGDIIDKDSILQAMNSRFAFKDMPMAVLEKILQRMSRGANKCLQVCKNNNYQLIRSLQQELEIFKKQEKSAGDEMQMVVDALSTWLKGTSIASKVAKDSVEKWLGDFFETRGIDVIFDVNELRADTIKNTDITNYQIGQFILYCKENDVELFSKIESIARGIMIAAAIYVDTTNIPAHVKARRLTNLNVYLDTSLVLCALNYKRPEQKVAADAPLDLLRENGANLYIFPQHKQEIVDILRSFRDRDGYDTKPQQTLERLETEGYTSIEIDREINCLSKKLRDLGIELAPREEYVKADGELKGKASAYIDYAGLSNYITEKIPQYERSKQMLENDVDAISYVILQRDGMRYETIESCQSIFLTTNYGLARESNRFLHYEPHRMHISPIITDIDLTSILWVKYAMQNPEIPRLWLISSAKAAVAPTPKVMDRFYEISVRLSKDGELTEDEAADMRYSTYARAEIMAECGGDPDVLEDTSVLAVRDRVKDRYTEKESAATAAAIAEGENYKVNLDASNRKNTDSQTKLKEKIGEIRKKAGDNAEINARKTAKRWSKVVTWGVTGIMLFSLIAIICDGFASGTGVWHLFATIISAIGAVVLWLPCIKVKERIENKIYSKAQAKQYAKEIEKAKPQIDALEEAIETLK